MSTRQQDTARIRKSAVSRRAGQWGVRATLATALTGTFVLVTSSAASALTVNNEEPPGVGGFQDILNWGGWAVTVLGVIGFLAVGGTMILQHRRGEGGESVGKLGMVMGGLLVAVAAGPLVNALA